MTNRGLFLQPFCYARKPVAVIAIDFTAFAPLVIAKVRVSGGHLCKAEAPTEPAGETQNGCGNPFSFRGLRILSCYALRMTYRLVIANTYGVRIYFRLPVIASEQSERGNPPPPRQSAPCALT